MKKVSTIVIVTGIILLSLLPLWDLTHAGLPVTHDGQDHVARIANFYRSLREGNLIPRWAANLNWGYGHPILMFLYPLPSYMASVFHAVGFSLIDSTKLVFAVAFIASILAMYIWISAAWGRTAGMTASILYAFAPYRFVDLYVRGAIGEHVAFVFPPVICYGLYRLAHAKDRAFVFPFIVVALGVASLIMSHNALSLMFLPLIALYALYVAFSDAQHPVRFLVVVISGVLFGFGLSAFFWVPGLFEGKYTLRDIVTAGEFTGRFVPWLSFLYSPWSYGGGNELSKWLGAGQILTLILAFITLRRRTKYQRFLTVSILLLFITLFVMTGNSAPIWNAVTLLQKFQFPWRLLSVSTFIIAVIGGVVVYLAKDKSRRWVMTAIILVSVFATVPMWRAKEYKSYPESFFTGIYNSTTDTGESSPIWSVRFMEQRPQALAYLQPSSGTITVKKRTTEMHVYTVKVTAPARFVESTLYFPGWQVILNGVPLPADKLIFQDPTYRGLMTFDLDPGEYEAQFIFTETRLRRVASAVSVASLILFVLCTATIRILWRKKE